MVLGAAHRLHALARGDTAFVDIMRDVARSDEAYRGNIFMVEDGIDHFLVALNDLKKEGLVRTTGMSTKTVAGGIACLDHADMAMVTYNLQHHDEVPVIEHAAAHHKGILIKKAFASGHLNDTLADPVQESLNQILGTSGVGSIIAGTINPKHLQENVAKARQACQP